MANIISFIAFLSKINQEPKSTTEDSSVNIYIENIKGEDYVRISCDYIENQIDDSNKEKLEKFKSYFIYLLINYLKKGENKILSDEEDIKKTVLKNFNDSNSKTYEMARKIFDISRETEGGLLDLSQYLEKSINSIRIPISEKKIFQGDLKNKLIKMSQFIKTNLSIKDFSENFYFFITTFIVEKFIKEDQDFRNKFVNEKVLRIKDKKNEYTYFIKLDQ